MNEKSFSDLIGNYDTNDETLVSKMAVFIEKYPYFQLPRFIYTKSLIDQNKDPSNTALNQLSLYTSDRAVLKNGIESPFTFTTKSNDLIEESNTTVEDKVDKEVEISETIERDIILHKEPSEATIPSTDKTTAGEKPASDVADLKMSFTEWVVYTTDNEYTEQTVDIKEEENEKQPLSDKLPIIDRFIAADPKIAPVEKGATNNIVNQGDFYSEELMTETLAKLLVKQKKYKKAIKAYKILSLKYPEKNVFFAGRIQDIKNLPQ
ncbi:MAG: hypothetical protein ISP64_09430 [Flavobacteriaceae bacterium]|jgi:hypothetical protein|nr:hypothetical protein [Flavobacteriaceae bacterium]